MMADNFITILTAAGAGKRFGGGKRKQFVSLCGKPLFLYSLEVLRMTPGQQGIILVVPQDEIEHTGDILSNFGYAGDILKIVPGGELRRQSVKNGFNNLPADADLVAVHDGVRPFITMEMVERAVNACRNSDGTTLAVPVKDTIKQSNGTKVIRTIDRDQLWQIQTVQVFKTDVLQKAYTAAENRGNPAGFFGTDECFLVEKIGGSIELVMGSYYNIKVTTPEDLKYAEWLINEKIV
ncbi:MAG: 2-C-methyl-D-erythritol 4-phosphate cytidylyltransferase [bacterium]